MAEGNLGSVGSVRRVTVRGSLPSKPPTSGTRLPWGNDGRRSAKPEKLEELECVGETSGLNPVGINPVGIVPVRKTGQRFSLLNAAERFKEGGESKVIIEQNGIHFINSEAIGPDSDKEELNAGFKKLVESVVGKT
jgi:hypothetical protein